MNNPKQRVQWTRTWRKAWLRALVSGAKPTMKKWRRANGIKLTASLRRSLFNCARQRLNEMSAGAQTKGTNSDEMSDTRTNVVPDQGNGGSK